MKLLLFVVSSFGWAAQFNSVGPGQVDVGSQHGSSECVIEDPCKLCSFVELEQLDACQETGYRLIEKCSPQSTNPTFQDRACPASSDANLISQGLAADASIQRTSLCLLFFFIALLTAGSYAVLERRRKQILGEAFSHLTILKK